MRVIYTSKGMLKTFGVRVVIRCALSIQKYGNSGKREIEAILRRLFDDDLCSGLFIFSASILNAQHW
jgi:hypothetical protein